MIKIKSAIILCGGKSTRMGFDKQKIRINDQLIVLHIANQLALLVDEIIIVTNNPELLQSCGGCHKRLWTHGRSLFWIT